MISQITLQAIYDLLRFETMLMNEFLSCMDLPRNRVAKEMVPCGDSRIKHHASQPLVRERYRPKPRGAQWSDWPGHGFNQENPTLVMDEVPSRHSETDEPRPAAVSKGPVTPTQPGCRRQRTKKWQSSKPVAVISYEVVKPVATPATGFSKMCRKILGSLQSPASLA